MKNDNGSYSDVSFSPDGEYIMYGYGYDVYIYTLADGVERPITPGGDYGGPWYMAVDWWKNGESVIIKEFVSGEISEININTLEMTYLFSYDPSVSFDGRLSPNGARFLATRDLQVGLDNYIEIRLYDTSTWEYEVLFKNVEYGYIRSGGWSSDGNEILLVYEPEYDEYIVVYNLEKEEIRYATWTNRQEQGYANTYVFDPVWSVEGDRIFYNCGIPHKIWVVDSP
ncbi:MAG: WD40 repeat domain-containing protein [bacterium]|nr:WD40 repeat domain-containing protein [bacterium]